MSIPDTPIRYAARQSGLSLVELVMFIVVVSVGVVGLLAVQNVTSKSSADPMVRKQALAIAESMLEEVMLMPFTFCDPDDENAETATTVAACVNDQDKGGGTLNGPTPAAETRYSATNPFDNVADYAGFAMNTSGIYDITSGGAAAIAGLGAYKLKPISISRVTTLPNVPASAALLITVTVVDPLGEEITVEGIRTRYAPVTTP